MTVIPSACSSSSHHTTGATIDGNTTTTPSHHHDYYFDDGNLVILVENTLFNVFRSTFTRHSRVFNDIFALPIPTAGLGHDIEGSSDRNPLKLPGISNIDFERLLWILYPPTFCKHRARSAEEWTSILHLATRWEFEDIRALAIRELERCTLSPVDKIVLSKEYDIDTLWALNAYKEICLRPNAVTFQEASALGLEIVVRISQLREKLRYGAGRPHSSGSAMIWGRRGVTRSGILREDLRINPRRTDALNPPEERHVVNNRKTAISRALRPSDTSRLVAEAFGLSAQIDAREKRGHPAYT